MRGPGIWRRIAGIVFVAIAGVFLGLTIRDNWQAVRQHEWAVDLIELVVSTVALVLVYAWGGFVWERVLHSFEPKHASYPLLLRIWFLSSLARYIPGKIWQFVALSRLARNTGLSPLLLLTSMMVLMSFTLLSATVVAAMALPLEEVGIPILKGRAVYAVPVLAVLLVHPGVLNAGLQFLPRLLRRDLLRWHGTWVDGIVLLLLSLVSWFIYGIAFYLFVDSLIDTPLVNLPRLSAVNAVAFLAGYLVFISPAGLGVREAAMALLLTPMSSSGLAVIIAVAARLWTIAAEVLGSGIVLITRSKDG